MSNIRFHLPHTADEWRARTKHARRAMIYGVLAWLNLLATMSNLTAVAQQTAAPPIEFARAELRVVLPIAPSPYEFTSRFKYPRGEKIRRGRIYTAYHDRAVYVVEIYEADDTARALRELLETRSEKQEYQRDVRVGGVSAREYRRDIKDSESSIRYFNTKRCVYVLEVAARDSSSSDVRRFLDSASVSDKYVSIADDKTIIPEPLVINVAPRTVGVNTNGAGEGGGKENTDGIGLGRGEGRSGKRPEGVAEAPLKVSELTRRLVPVFRAEPSYTDRARKNNVQGTVTLRVLFSSNGRISNIVPIKRLPDGLTEEAITAVKLMKFLPAEKDGRLVSTYGVVNYAFNIY